MSYTHHRWQAASDLNGHLADSYSAALTLKLAALHPFPLAARTRLERASSESTIRRSAVELPRQKIWCTGKESNLQRADLQPAALPVELPMQTKKPRPARMPTGAHPPIPYNGKAFAQSLPVVTKRLSSWCRYRKARCRNPASGPAGTRAQQPSHARGLDTQVSIALFSAAVSLHSSWSPRTFAVADLKNKKPRCARAHRGFVFIRRARSRATGALSIDKRALTS